MAAVPASSTFDVRCPDCARPVAMSYSLHPTVDRARGIAEIRVQADHDDFERRFTEHVAADPAVHPSFATPLDGSPRDLGE